MHLRSSSLWCIIQRMDKMLNALGTSLNKVAQKTPMCFFHLEKKQVARVFASLPIEAMKDQTFRHTVYPAQTQYAWLIWRHSHMLSNSCVQAEKNERERESWIHIKSYCICQSSLDSVDGWLLFWWMIMSLFWINIFWWFSDAFSLKTQALTEISLAKAMCFFGFWSSNYLLLKHISQTYSVECVMCAIKAARIHSPILKKENSFTCKQMDSAGI